MKKPMTLKIVLSAMPLVVLSVCWLSVCAGANDAEKTLRKSSLIAQANANKFNDTKVTEDQESQAIRFVEAHHPELANLLVVLKNMNRDKYESAIRDVTKTLKRLDSTQKRDSDLYALDVEGWKIQSKIDLLLARGLAGDQDKDIDKKTLKSLVQDRVTNQKSRLERELQLLKEREKSLRESLESLEKNSQERAEQQYAALLKKVKNNKSEKSKDNKATDR
jgi:hypothetical protein